MKTTLESFLRATANHQITVLRDEGVYRHIRFKKPETRDQYFDLVTWPDHICYTGDMGTYVFTRVYDMFDFFRTGSTPELLKINPDYWIEKLIAVNCFGEGNAGAKEFDPEKLKSVINEYRNRWIRDSKKDGTLTKAERSELWESIQDEILDKIDDYKETVLVDIHKFECLGYEFNEFFEHDLTKYKESTIWCCYALTWGVMKYEEYKREQAKATDTQPVKETI